MRRLRVGLAISGALALCLAAGPTWAEDGSSAADYERLQRWRYDTRPIPVPAGGLRFSKDVASWELETGSFRLAEPTSGGVVTGLLFEGKGRYRMEVPDPIELAQLRRLTGAPELERVDEPFTRMVLRFSDPALVGPFAVVGSRGNNTYRPHRLARQRHEHWLGLRQHDADSRIVAARSITGAEYLRADVKTTNGWLTFEFDSERHEEIHLDRYHSSHSFLESWLSLDRAEHRTAGGRPRVYLGSPVDTEHLDVVARLVKTGKDPGPSESARATLLGELSTTLTLRARRPGLRALQLYLHPMARVDRVTSGGRELAFLRDHIGGRSLSRDNRMYDFSLLVLFDRPLAVGERRRITFDYELEITNYLPGRFWYPTLESGFVAPSDLYTASLEVTTREDYEIRAMGRRVSEVVEGGRRTARWEVERPAKMISLSVSRKSREWSGGAEGAPEVVVFSPPPGHDPDSRMSRMGEEIVASLAYFQQLFEQPLPAERIYATVIQATHGQAFDGLLHLGEFSAFRERSGPIEVFLAHEVAHQWWGHLIGWSSYRDQWLSEGLAQYSALMYLESEVDGGERLFREAVTAHRNDLIGSIKTTMSPFSRGLALDSARALDRIGPISHGFRAAVRESPRGYFAQSYLKGALVMHMLRARLGDEVFVDVLRTFAARYRGGHPTTEDFAAVVAERAGGDWDWFFDQWVRHAAIPTYRWATRMIDASPDHGPRVEIEVARGDVGDDFRVDLPVRVDFADGTEESYLVTVSGNEETVRLDLPRPSRRVVVDPDRVVLARTKGRFLRSTAPPQ